METAPAAPEVPLAAPEAVQTTAAAPAYAQYQQQGMPPRPEYYVAAPPGPPMYPAPPVYQQQSSGGTIPWWVWMGAGFLAAKAASMVQDLVKKGPQAMMAEMAMKQMMKGMQQPGGAPGANPFGAAAGAPPFGPYGASNPFAPNFTPPVDTTATPVTPGAAAGAAAADSSRGEKFAQRVGGSPSQAAAAAPAQGKAAEPAAAAAAGAAAAASSNGAASSSNGSSSGSAKAVDVVEPVVKEPSSSGSNSSGGPTAAGFFTDVGAGDSSSSGGGGAAGAAQQDPAQMTAMMEKMLRDPNMQKMLYPYLPEPMRNPESIEWMLNNPEVRKQMEQVFAQSGMGMSPEMMSMMSQMDFSQEKVQAQFSELGLKPEDVIQKVLATPDLAAGFSNPKVQQAIFDISQNPMNISKYQDDPEVMKVLEKVTEIFAPQMQQQGMQK